jgi:hypothetical protein
MYPESFAVCMVYSVGDRNRWDSVTAGVMREKRGGRSFVLPFISVGPYLSGKVRQMYPRVSLSATSS